MAVELRPLVLHINDLEDQLGFGISYSINSASAPEQVPGKLDLRIIRKGTA